MKLRYFLFLIPYFLFILASCSVSKQISKQAQTILLNDTAIRTGHIGISIYEPATGKYWYEHNATRYFIPASNTKLFTLYAGMKYLGDSLVGLRYTLSGSPTDKHRVFAIQPTGDPTFLHPDFKRQPAMNVIATYAKLYKNFSLLDTIWKDDHLGNGWAWNDYEADYMTEKNSFPLYGNVITVEIKDLKNRNLGRFPTSKETYSPNIPLVNYSDSSGGNFSIFKTQHKFFDSLVNLNLYYLNADSSLLSTYPKIKINRALSSNEFTVQNGPEFKKKNIPFVTNGHKTAARIISDSTQTNYSFLSPIYNEGDSVYITRSMGHPRSVILKNWQTIHSQPSDSLFKPMMHRSDNFFAEQTLLMASNEYLGYMSDEQIIDTILKTTLKDVPQRPKWVDGSGLSRYNLFTPRSFVFVLDKMKNEFGMNRLKVILPTGGEGTIINYFKKDSGYIYAKTGTLSNNCALSGYLITKKGRLLIFSVLNNNYITGATPVRKAVEHFLLDIREKY